MFIDSATCWIICVIIYQNFTTNFIYCVIMPRNPNLWALLQFREWKLGWTYITQTSKVFIKQIFLAQTKLTLKVYVHLALLGRVNTFSLANNFRYLNSRTKKKTETLCKIFCLFIASPFSRLANQIVNSMPKTWLFVLLLNRTTNCHVHMAKQKKTV